MVTLEARKQNENFKLIGYLFEEQWAIQDQLQEGLQEWLLEWNMIHQVLQFLSMFALGTC